MTPISNEKKRLHPWYGPGMDPVLGLFPLDRICRKSNIQSTVWVHPHKLKLGDHARGVGAFPVCYRQGMHNTTPLHTHDFFEMILIIEGDGEYLTEKGPIPVFARDFIFVDNREPHALRAAGEGMQVLNICFLPSSVGYDDQSLKDIHLLNYYPLLQPFRPEKTEEGAVVGPTQISLDEISFRRALVDGLHLVELYQTRGLDGKDFIRPRLKALLQTLIHLDEDGRKSAHGGHGGLRAVLDYCQTHQGKKITLKGMAAHFGMNATYLSTLINRGFGFGFNQVLNGFRIESAKSLLVESSLPISRIALEVGYQNVSHFNLVFRQQVGCSPSTFLEKARRGSAGSKKKTKPIQINL